MKRLRNFAQALAATCLALSVAPAFADKANDTLKVAFTGEINNVDSYFNTTRGGVVLQRAIWDGLVHRDTATGEYVGNLATSWEWIDDTTLEFKLREGVVFHDGSPFTADDVVGTVEFIANPDSGVVTQRFVSWLAGAEKIDDLTVRLNLAEVFPSALEYLSGPISIYPSDYYAEVGPDGMGLKPIGTGPYRVESVKPGESYLLKKNEDYFDGPKGSPDIGTIDIRTIPDVNTQIAELFTGNINVAWRLPSDLAQKLDGTPGVMVTSASSIRVGFLMMDSAGRTGDTPLTDVRVRQAINHAINRQEMVDSLLKGGSKVVNTPCFPEQFGCVQEYVEYQYDPEKAKALLAEAGYDDGLSIEIYAFSNQDYVEAVAGYLSQVGITLDIKMLKFPAVLDKMMNDAAPMVFMSSGSWSLNDVSAIISEFFKHGAVDFARDDEILEWLDVADTAVDPEVRKEYYGKAIMKITEQAYWAPMFSYNTFYAFTDDVDYTPTNDEILHFVNMKWK
ncbi:ABC transporter substrate-binding protein [Arenibacterium halophilum]|uniref:ABC transporter substrate-binding protein n=1 Tax=Arenibacterium halophilum TaxID=2583821 RepID=A0ABY2WZJ4_9RHOB|nr:ABC transporter substrate-binding protein [Arenibacterium halophilum]TMV08365.1 ABC transporter substrate-binding protein [Arenibacterium halophilum]